MKRVYKEVLVALGTANLIFLRRWAEILPGSRDYFLNAPRGAATYLVLMGIVLLVALVGWTAFILARRSGNRYLLNAVRVLFLAAAALGLHGLGHEAWVFFGSPRFVSWFVLVLIALVASGLGWLQWRQKGWHRKILPVTISLMILLSPLAPILFVQGTVLALQDPAASPRWSEEPIAEAEPAPRPEGGRVVWIVLDELDRRLVFDERPPGLELPEFDRLRNESFSATSAQAARDRTLYSIPTMTTGRPLLDVEAAGPDRLLIEFADTRETENWGDADTIFSRAHEEGRRIGIAGTYHPYCRVFRELLSECAFFGYNAGNEGVAFEIRSHIYGTAEKIPIAPLRTALQSLSGVAKQHQQSAVLNHETLTPPAHEFASDEELDFVMIHLLVPHPAGYNGRGHGYWDPEQGTYATRPELTYLDNLVLADRTLQEIRTAMQESGMWNTTTVIISSDHGYRYSLWGQTAYTNAHAQALHRPTDHRVPLIVRPASSDPRPLEYDDRLNLILLRGFIEEALSTGFHNTSEIAHWFQVNGPGPEPEYRHR